MLQLMTNPAAAAAPTADEPRRSVDEAAAPSDASFVLEALVAADQPPLPALDAAALAALPVAPAAVEPLPGESAAEVQAGEVEALLGSLLAQSQVQVQARAEQALAAPQPIQAALAALSQADGRQQSVPTGKSLATADQQPATAGKPADDTAQAGAEEPSAARPQTALPDSAMRQLTALAVAGDGEQAAQTPLLEVPGGDSAAIGAARPALEAALRGEPNGPLSRPAALEQRLQLQGPEAKWGEQMLHALRDSVELQLKQNKQQATIRLDPAELGSLEIRLNQEGGRLQVQISAAQGDVARLLQQTSDRLRQDLIGQHFVQVEVQVSADSQSGQRHARQAPDPFAEGAPRAAREEQTDAGRAGQPVRSDVLVSV